MEQRQEIAQSSPGQPLPEQMHALPAEQQGTGAGQVMAIVERMAMNPNVDPDKLERLLDMQERIIAKNAEAAFNRAMVRAQSEMRPVVRDADNTHTSSRYAKLETIDRNIRPIYTGAGFALSFGTAECPAQGSIRVTCDVSHNEGHTKHYWADMPLDMSGINGKPNKTAIHAHGSTMSYAQRYLTQLIFNITLANEDDDGNAAGAQEKRSAQSDNKRKQGLPPYPDTKFKENLPKWRALITSGKKTAEHVINTLSSRATLTQQQVQQIKGESQ